MKPSPPKRSGSRRPKRGRIAQPAISVVHPIADFGKMDPFPERMVRNLDYAIVANTSADASTASTSGGGTLTLRLNDIFLPQTGGHQPYGFNTLETIYRRYKVRSVKLSLTAALNTSTTLAWAITGILPPGSTFSLGALANAARVCLEKPNFDVRVLQGDSNRAVVHWNHNIQMHQALNISKAEFEANVEDYAALVTASPSRVATFVLNNSSTTTSDPVWWTILAHYEVEFFERKILAESS